MGTVNLSLKIPEDVHQKLKIYSVMIGKSMSDILVEYVNTIEIRMPSLKGDKPKNKTRNTSVKKTRHKDDPVIKGKILALNAEGLSLGEIGKKLEAEGIKTATGLDKWNKQSLSRMLKRWGIELAKPQKTAS